MWTGANTVLAKCITPIKSLRAKWEAHVTSFEMCNKMGENHMPQFVCECIQWYDSIIPQGIFGEGIREKKNSNRRPNSLQKPALHIHHMMTNNSESQQ